MKKILVTGGAGYIGSTICSALEDAGYFPIVLDSLVKGLEEFVNDERFYEGNIADIQIIHQIKKDHPNIYAVIHCAAFCNVAESVSNPLMYYENNVVNTLRFFQFCRTISDRIIYSSSGSVYGYQGLEPQVYESMVPRPMSPYAHSKRVAETMLEDFCHSYDLRGVSLRYFNPIGADPEMRSGPYQKEDRLLDNLVDGYFKSRPIRLYGTNWATEDGTPLRDFIHVWDVAQAHVKILEEFDHQIWGYETFNVGIGRGYTVRQIIDLFNETVPIPVGMIVEDVREGDIAGAYADITKIRKWFNWEPTRDIRQAILDHIIWKGTRIPDYEGILERMKVSL